MPRADRSNAGVVVALVLVCAAMPVARAVTQVASTMHGGRSPIDVLRPAYAAIGVAELFGVPVMGLLAARFGGRRVLSWSLFACALSSVWVFTWLPPSVMVLLFALGGLAQVGSWCAIIAVIAECWARDRARVVGTALSAATAVGAVLANVAWIALKTMFGTRTIALIVPLLLLVVAFVVRGRLRDPAPRTAVAAGDGYRDVTLVEEKPQPLARLQALVGSRVVFYALAAMLAIGVARGIANNRGVTALGLYATTMFSVPAVVIASLIATAVVARTRDWIVSGIALPLGLAVVFALGLAWVRGIATLPLAIAIGVASAVVAGGVPFVLGEDREGAPIVAGMLVAASLAGAAIGARVEPSRGWLVATLAVVLGLLCALALARHSRER